MKKLQKKNNNKTNKHTTIFNMTLAINIDTHFV